MKQPTIAEILHYAADYCLSPFHYSPDIQVYSCSAIHEACLLLIVDPIKRWDILRGLNRMGLKSYSLTEFNDVLVEDRQAYRYAWLKFAALIAEEQGV